MVAIVLGTNEGRDSYVEHFFSTVPSDCEDMITVVSGSYEITQIQDAYCDGLRSFVYLQDSCLVTDWSAFLRKIGDAPETAYLIPRPSCYAMVYSARVLEFMEFPTIRDKEDSIFFETVFLDQYELTAKRLELQVPVLYPEMTDGEALGAERYYNGLPERRLHLRSSDRSFHKMKATYR